MDLTKSVQLLEQSKHRVTGTRKAILRAILKMKKPFSAADVVKAITRKDKKNPVDLVTIYRNFPVLEEVGIICRADFSDEMARYMISEPGHGHHHHHIVCKTCHRIEPVDFCILEAQEQVLSKLGFKEISHKLEFAGICPACSP